MSHKNQNKSFVRIDCTIPKELKRKLEEKALEQGLNLKSTLIIILNDALNN